jgi:hypothetical protein
MIFTFTSMHCHPERSEGSRACGTKVRSFAALRMTILGCAAAISLVATGAEAGNRQTINPDEPVRRNMRATGAAQEMMDAANKNGAFARDFYRMGFMQIMGLVFFDPATPDIGACQKDFLNYHLPQLTKTYINYEDMKQTLARTMGEVYTEDEILWMKQFYASPFGARMFQKQLMMNERITRMMAQRYTFLKPQFTTVYTQMAERCPATRAPGEGSAVEAPRLSDEILAVPDAQGSSPIPPSPGRE